MKVLLCIFIYIIVQFRANAQLSSVDTLYSEIYADILGKIMLEKKYDNLILEVGWKMRSFDYTHSYGYAPLPMVIIEKNDSANILNLLKHSITKTTSSQKIIHIYKNTLNCDYCQYPQLLVKDTNTLYVAFKETIQSFGTLLELNRNSQTMFQSTRIILSFPVVHLKGPYTQCDYAIYNYNIVRKNNLYLFRLDNVLNLTK